MQEKNVPLVSVITGYYNRGHLLDRTLQSILSQTYQNLELIIFDDFSTDDTRIRLAKYQELDDPRIKVILHETNLGFVQGMINAINVAKGEFIAVQSSGDISLPERIAAQSRALVDNPEIGVVGCHYENIIEQRGLVRLRQPCANNTTFDSLVKGNVFSHGEVMFRRSTYERVGGYRKEFKYCQDYDLWLRMIQVCRFYTVPELHFKRFIQFDGVSYAPTKAILQARYHLLCQRLPKMTATEQEAALCALREDRIKDVILVSDPALQKRIFRSCLRSIIWGEINVAITYSEYITNPYTRKIINLTGRTMEMRIFSLPRKLIYNILGIKAG
jgi:glycosyltransferase involved in cell wall biosynthesis